MRKPSERARAIDARMRDFAKEYYKEHGFEPNPYNRAALVDSWYLRACKELGYRPRRKKA